MAGQAPKRDMKQRTRLWIAEHLMLASVGTVVLLLLFGYLLVFAPELRRIREANVTRSLEQERDLKNQYLLSLNALASNYAAVPQERIEALRRMIPSENDVPGILAAIEASARRSDIAILAMSFSPGDPIPGLDGVRSVGINLTLSHASYERFKLFVEALEEDLRLFDIQSMSLNPAAASYTLLLRAYAQSRPLL